MFLLEMCGNVNTTIMSNNIKQKIEERVMLSYYMNKMSLNTLDKSSLSMNVLQLQLFSQNFKNFGPSFLFYLSWECLDC